MDMPTYNYIGHDEHDTKMDKQHIFPIQTTHTESSDPEIRGRVEYWTAPRIVDINKNLQIDLCRSIIYGDSIEHMMLPKDGSIHGDAQSWHDLTGASCTNSVTNLSFSGLARSGKLGQTRTLEEKELYHTRELKVGGDGEDGGVSIASKHRWEEVAPSYDKNHHLQNKILKKELRINSCQVDQSIESQLQSSQEFEDCNMFEIGMQRRSCQDIHELDIDSKRIKRVRDHITYEECQKNQSVDCGMTSVDGCGKFLSSGKDGKLAFTCIACGCHRNFHQRIVLCKEEEQEQELLKVKSEKEEEGGNHYKSIFDIERVAHELIATANGAITLAQDTLCYSQGRIQELSIEKQNVLAKISLENLNHIAKVINLTTECLTFLQKPSILQKDKKLDCHDIVPSSSDASPVITIEKQAIHSLLTPSPACAFGAIGRPTLKNSIAIFSDACGMHNYGGVPRKPIECGNQKLKRTRTRISLEQREKLNAFAEKAGWTIVGQRKETIDATCQYIGIEPKTLKYWIHNSKQKSKRQPSQSDDMNKL